MDTHASERKNSRYIFASVILYLNTLPPDAGGETCFPHKPQAGARLLGKRITHTDVKLTRGVDFTTGEINTVQPRAAEVLLCAAEEVCEAKAVRVATDRGEISVKRSSAGGLAVVPQRGLGIVLYTRHAGTEGAIDPASWHGGAAVAPGHRKLILQKFKMVHSEEEGEELTEPQIAALACNLTCNLGLTADTAAVDSTAGDNGAWEARC